MSTNQPTNTPTPDWRELRRQERAQRRAERGNSGAWILGAILIGVGLILTWQNFFGTMVQNWWALFILLPAAGSLAAAWREFQNNGGVFTMRLLAPLAMGLLLFALSVAFLFNYVINWALVVPVLLIVFGIIVLLGGFFPRK
jgi:hypothetical protein